jgi:hypothetical protein
LVQFVDCVETRFPLETGFFIVSPPNRCATSIAFGEREPINLAAAVLSSRQENTTLIFCQFTMGAFYLLYRPRSDFLSTAGTLLGKFLPTPV